MTFYIGYMLKYMIIWECVWLNKISKLVPSIVFYSFYDA